MGCLVFVFLLTNIDSGMQANVINKAIELNMYTEEEPYLFFPTLHVKYLHVLNVTS